jgi:nitrate reductase NapD
MNICGILVHSRPENTAVVRKRLVDITGIEVHGINEDGRMVVTLEEDNEDRMADTLMNLQNVDGVVSASMIYHHREEDEETREEVMQ